MIVVHPFLVFYMFYTQWFNVPVQYKNIRVKPDLGGVSINYSDKFSIFLKVWMYYLLNFRSFWCVYQCFFPLIFGVSIIYSDKNLSEIHVRDRSAFLKYIGRMMVDKQNFFILEKHHPETSMKFIIHVNKWRQIIYI